MTFPKVRRASATVALAALLAAACSESPESLLASGKDYLARNDSPAAIIQIKNALQQNPGLAEGRYLLGKALLESGDPVAAEVELRKARDLGYPDDQLLPQLARTLMAKGAFRKVVDDLAKAELSSPESRAEVQTTLGMAYTALGDRPSAAAALDAALAAQAGHAPALLAQASLKAGEGDLAGALVQVAAVLEKAAENHQAWQLKGDLLQAGGEREAALAAYRKALELRPEFLPAHFALAFAFLQQARLEEAAGQLETLKKLAPRHPQTLYLEAQLAYRKKEFARVRELTQQLLRIAPNHPGILELAGAGEYQLKSLLQAESYLGKALQQAPDLAMARRLLIAIYLSQGEAKKALDALQPVLGKIDDDPALLTLAGGVFLHNGDLRKAEEYAAKAAALDPKDARKRTTLALAHIMQGHAETAFAELEEIAAGDSGTTADLALIASYLQRKEGGKALDAVAALEKKQPDNPIVHQLRGRALLLRQDVAGARRSFERALAVSPTYFPAAAALASLDLGERRPEAARQRFEAILAADGKNMQAYVALAELRARSGGTADEVAALLGKAVAAQPGEATPRLLLVDLHLRHKDAKRALAAAQEAAAALPERPEILDALGRAQVAAGDFNQGLATYNKLAGLQPASPQPYLRMAEASLAAKNPDAALQSLQKGLEIKPDLVGAQQAMLKVHLDAGRPQEALKIAREVQRQRPGEAIGYILEGDIGAARKSWGEAAAAYRAGLGQTGPQLPAPQLAVKLHAALLAGGSKAEADTFAADWLKKYPREPAFRLYLAESAGARQDFAAAARHYRALLEIQPNNPMLLNNLAWALGKEPKGGAEAIGHAEQANRLAPDQPAFMDTLAVLLAGQGEHGRAVDLLKKAVALAPQAPAIRLNLARALLGAGQKAEAKKELEELARLGSRFTAQAEVAQLMKQL